MIVWRGWGILVLVIAFAAALLVQVVVDALVGPDTYTRNTSLWLAVALLLAAPIVWMLGRRLNGRAPRVLTDQQTGEEVILRPDHSFIWIKMEYWAIGLALIAGLMLLGPLVRR
jgi:hypothetical protein